MTRSPLLGKDGALGEVPRESPPCHLTERSCEVRVSAVPRTGDGRCVMPAERSCASLLSPGILCNLPAINPL
jgi:hypothetical protein